RGDHATLVVGRIHRVAGAGRAGARVRAGRPGGARAGRGGGGRGGGRTGSLALEDRVEGAQRAGQRVVGPDGGVPAHGLVARPVREQQGRRHRAGPRVGQLHAAVAGHAAPPMSSSAIWIVFSAAPLRRLSAAANSTSPLFSGTDRSWRMRPTRVLS